MAGPVRSVKEYAESASIPPSYAYFNSISDDDQLVSDPVLSDSIPIIDFSRLTSPDPHQRSAVVRHLGAACRDWGFFMVVNHGVPVEMMAAVMNGLERFFDLAAEEKQEFQGNHVLDPIRCGTSFNSSVDKVFFWRDFLKVLVHPSFHFPHKPSGFSEVAKEYCGRVREIARAVLEGISESLGLEHDCLEKAIEWESGLQVFAGNLYPPCPKPEVAMGMPPHSDHGLLTLLVHNQIGGLQVNHGGKWVPADGIPEAFLVNTGDHLELNLSAIVCMVKILSNGRYRSNIHRAVVNNRSTRISIAIAHGPSLDTVVTPVSDLVDAANDPPAYRPVKYRDYLELQQSTRLKDKSCLDSVRVGSSQVKR